MTQVLTIVILLNLHALSVALEENSQTLLLQELYEKS